MALCLGALHLATAQGPGFEDPLVSHFRFPVRPSLRRLRLRGASGPIRVFSLPLSL